MRQTIYSRKFFQEVRKELRVSKNQKLRKLTPDDLMALFEIVFIVLSRCLKGGTNVIFNRFLSLTTKPIKKRIKVTGGGYAWTYDERIRLKPLARFRDLAETNMTEAEYEQRKKDEGKKGAK